VGHLVGGAFRLQFPEEALGAADHVLGSHGLGGLGPHLVRLGQEGTGLPLGVGALAAPPLLVVLTGLQVGVPPEVVDVELGAVGVEVEHVVDGQAEQLDVVGDDHQPPGEGLQVVPQPHDGVVVEVVGRLVQQERVGIGEQDARQLDPAALAPGQGPQRLVEHPGGEPEVRGDPCGLRLGGPAALRGELRVEPDVTLHGPVPPRSLGGRHLVLGPADAPEDVVDAACRENAVTGLLLEVTGAGVLRQVAHRAGPRDGPSPREGLGGHVLACEQLREGRLPRPVATDEADPHPAVHAERGGPDQFPGSDAQGEVLDCDHGGRLLLVGGGGRPIIAGTEPVPALCLR